MVSNLVSISIILLLPTTSWCFVLTTSKKHHPQQHAWTTAFQKKNLNTILKEKIKPSSTTTISTTLDDNTKWYSSARNEEEEASLFAELCDQLGITSPKGIHRTVQLRKGGSKSPEEEQDERGVYTNTEINRNDIIFQIPLSSCLTDDTPPSWLFSHENEEDEDDDDINSHLSNHPSHWATRLAASLLEIQERTMRSTDSTQKMQEKFGLWLSLLPSPQALRASLPVHWSDEALSNARCCALELAVDSAYFTRAESVDALWTGLKRRISIEDGKDLTQAVQEEVNLASRCHRALDIVQTRTCRVDRLDGMCPPLRVLAPILDFVNHGGRKRANASFYLQLVGDEPFVIVRAEEDILPQSQILFDYGDSTRPSWRCLASYGFVPELTTEEDEIEENVAEVFMDGMRYEVGPGTVPYDMVEAAIAAMRAENTMESGGILNLDINQFDLEDPGDNDGDSIDNPLTSVAALRIAKRISDVAFDLLLVPDVKNNEGSNEEDGESAAEVQAASLAAGLRWSQHRVLMACAVGLRDYASSSMGFHGTNEF